MKERDLHSENLKLKEKYDKQNTRFDLLKKTMNTGEKSKEKKRKMDESDSSAEEDHAVRTKSANGRGKSAGTCPKVLKYQTPETSLGRQKKEHTKKDSGSGSDPLLQPQPLLHQHQRSYQSLTSKSIAMI